MADLNDTPKANRIHIAFFGLRNAGKSTLVNAFAGQELAIVSDVAGTTTDPVSKAMEILPLGPCLLTDTAGLDDVGALGEMRVKKAFGVLATTDIAVWVAAAPESAGECQEFRRFSEECRKHGVTVLRYNRGDDVESLRKAVASVKVAESTRPLVGDLVAAGDKVLLVCPQDGSAPKGRLILPQQQLIREILDAGGIAQVCQPDSVASLFRDAAGCTERVCKFVVTDSQAFGAVESAVPKNVPLTSFSILFARAKGDLQTYCEGLAALGDLKDGDTVLVSEGCTHHRQCGDIGTVKIPRAIGRLTGKRLNFVFSSGGEFPVDKTRPNLVVHCGGCMLTRREVQRRISVAKEAGAPITNYGLALAAANGIAVDPVTCMVARRA